MLSVVLRRPCPGARPPGRRIARSVRAGPVDPALGGAPEALGALAQATPDWLTAGPGSPAEVTLADIAYTAGERGAIIGTASLSCAEQGGIRRIVARLRKWRVTP